MRVGGGDGEERKCGSVDRRQGVAAARVELPDSGGARSRVAGHGGGVDGGASRRGSGSRRGRRRWRREGAEVGGGGVDAGEAARERRPAGAVSTTVDGARERRPKVAASTTRRGSGGRRATPSTAGEGRRGRPQAELRRRASGLAKASRRRDHRRSGNAARVGGSRVRGRPGVGGVGWPGGCARLLAQPGCGLGCIVEVTGPPTGRPITSVPGRAGPRAGGAAQARARGAGRASPGTVWTGPGRAWAGPN